MYLTIEEQRNLQQFEIRKEKKPIQTKKKFAPKYLCSLGHELFPIYYRNHHMVMVKRIISRYYCITCDKYFTVKLKGNVT
jgi:hypothetical protein